MICLLLLLAFTHSLFGAPSVTRKDLSSNHTQEYALQKRETLLLDNSRTIWDIVWACLATIFACTWVAVHPNIPSPRANWKARFRSRLVVMVYAWIAPECVTMWAVRQLLSARKLVKMYNERRGIPEDTRNYFRLLWDSCIPLSDNTDDMDAQRWTLTHGFFAQMGGYMIFRESKPYWTLFLEDVDLERDMDLVPYYTENELMDRSKGDVLSKGIALLQTLWFVTQYFTRVAAGLPLTELETATLAFATLNIATYVLWWHKPLNVQWPIRVHELPSSRATSFRVHAGAHFGGHRITPHSTSDHLSDGLSIPVITWEDSPDPTDAEWEELREIPWFPAFDEETTVKENRSLGSRTLAATPASAYKELEKAEGEAQLNSTGEYEWDDIYELPWFPATEVPVAFYDPTDIAGQEDRRQRLSFPDLPSRVKWYYKIPRRWGPLPRYILLAVDGGWYTIHLHYDEIESDDELSLNFRNESLSVDFYIPLFLRNLPWMVQMCLLVPLWSPYVVSVAFYNLIVYPFFVFLLSPLASMTGMSQNTDEPWLDPRYPLQVPVFYAGSPGLLDQNSRVKSWYTIFLLTSVFGAIHGFSWPAYFPSPTERNLWRISTLCICSVPPTVALWVLYRRSSFPQFGINTMPPGTTGSFSLIRIRHLSQLFKFLAARFGKMGMPFYIFGRITLITIAFTSLRNLPPAIFKSVPWTSAIPHL